MGNDGGEIALGFSRNLCGDQRKEVMNVTFPEAVLLRPKIYTLGGTFEEVVAFLEGYVSGMAKADPYAPPVLQWASFQSWLSERLGVSSSEAFLRFREIHESNQASLEKMWEWFTQFQAQETLKPAA